MGCVDQAAVIALDQELHVANVPPAKVCSHAPIAAAEPVLARAQIQAPAFTRCSSVTVLLLA